MKPVILTLVLVLSLPCLAAARNDAELVVPAPQTIVTAPPSAINSPFKFADQAPASVRPQPLISPYSVIRYDQPAQPIKPAPVVSSEPEPPQFVPYRSTSRSKQLRPAYLP